MLENLLVELENNDPYLEKLDLRSEAIPEQESVLLDSKGFINFEKVPNDKGGYYYNPAEGMREPTDLDFFDKRRILLYKAKLEFYLEIKFGEALNAIVGENAAKEDGAESGTLMNTIAKMLYVKGCTSSEAIEGLTVLSKESPKDQVYANKMIAVIQAHYANFDNLNAFINKQLSNVSRRELEEKQTTKTPLIKKQKVSTVTPSRNQFAEKVSSNFVEASTLVAKHKDVSILKEEKSTRFPWGKLALLLLVMGLGGVIGLAVAGLFFSLWTIIPAAVFLIGVGVGIKALYNEHQQRQRAYQKSLLIPDSEKNTFTNQDEDQSLLSQNQLENSYQTRRIKAEEASVKLTEILKNKGLDFKKAEALINVRGHGNGDFYLTYESLLSVLTITVALDEEGEAEFQKGWRLVQELVKDNPSKRELPYDNCIVIEVDTILNMDSAIHVEKLSSSEILPKSDPQIKIAEIDLPDLNVNSSSIFFKAREYAPKLPDNFCYSINLMWINSEKDEVGEYVCCRKNGEAMNYELNQLRKWCIANPEAEINFWYDSACTNEQAIENTKNLLATLSAELNAQINLKDVREIPFVADNSDLFQTTIAVYSRIDLLKLIICLFCMENCGHHSAIFSDWSIGGKVEQVLSKHQLYSEAMLKKLEEFGMLVGHDSGKSENQFLQMLNTPLLLKSAKHAINCCLLLTVNTLNAGLQSYSDKNERYFLLRNLHGVPYNATMTYIHLYFLLLRDSKKIEIRADIVNEGNDNEWKDYDPEQHGYLMFGNVFNGRMHYGMHKKPKEVNWIGLSETIKFDVHYGFHPESAYCNVPYDAVRKDLNPGHVGRNHQGNFDNAKPINGKEFQCTFWPLAPDNSSTYVAKIVI